MEEAELILSKVELPAAAIYLAGYSVECVLKVLLIAVTPAKKRRALLDVLKKDFGHNLHCLQAGISKRGSNVPLAITQSLLFVSSWSPDLRYEPWPGDANEAARFLKEAKGILIWADRRM